MPFKTNSQPATETVREPSWRAREEALCGESPGESLFLFFRQDLIVYTWLTQNLLCSPGYPPTHRNLPASASQLSRTISSAVIQLSPSVLSDWPQDTPTGAKICTWSCPSCEMQSVYISPLRILPWTVLISRLPVLSVMACVLHCM